MTRLTKRQQNALKVLRAKLTHDDPGNFATDEVKASLYKIRLYLDSWVLPLIDEIEGKSFREHHIYIERDLARVELARKKPG